MPSGKPDKRRRDRFPPTPYEQQSDKWREEHPPKKRRLKR